MPVNTVIVLAALVAGLLALTLWSFAAGQLVVALDGSPLPLLVSPGLIVTLGYVFLFAAGTAFGFQLGFGLASGSRVLTIAALLAAMVLLAAHLWLVYCLLPARPEGLF